MNVITQARRVTIKRLSAGSIMSALQVFLLLISGTGILVCSTAARQGLARVANLEKRALGISQLECSIVTRREEMGGSVDAPDGGAVAHSNPSEELVALLMTPHTWSSAGPQNICVDFWSSVYQAIHD